MTIPKIIHQTWKTKEIPENLLFCTESWKKLNPGWEYTLWTDEGMEGFVKKYFPEIHGMYIAYPSGIFRADIFRLLVVYQMGGVYVDLDMECIKNLDYLFEKYIKDAELTLAYADPFQEQVIWGISPMVHAFFLAAKPGDEILESIIKTIAAKGSRHELSDVCWITGPNAITKCLKSIRTHNKIMVLDYKIAAPIVDVFSGNIPLWYKRKSFQMLFKRKYYQETCMVHYWYHGYVKGESALSLSRVELEQRLKDSTSFLNYAIDVNFLFLGDLAQYVRIKTPKLYFLLPKIFKKLKPEGPKCSDK